jgi:hypothetical protein
MGFRSGGQFLTALLKRKFKGLTENPRRYWVCGECRLQPCDLCGRKYRHGTGVARAQAPNLSGNFSGDFDYFARVALKCADG